MKISYPIVFDEDVLHTDPVTGAYSFMAGGLCSFKPRMNWRSKAKLNLQILVTNALLRENLIDFVHADDVGGKFCDGIESDFGHVWMEMSYRGMPLFVCVRMDSGSESLRVDVFDFKPDAEKKELFAPFRCTFYLERELGKWMEVSEKADLFYGAPAGMFEALSGEDFKPDGYLFGRVIF